MSGQPYADYVQEELFEPAGLRHSGYYRDPRWTSEQVAHGYDARKFGEENSPFHWPEITWACIGGGCLVSGLLFGWLRAKKPTFGDLPTPTAKYLQEFGLAVFIASVGLATSAAASGTLETAESALVAPSMRACCAAW